MAKGTLNRVTLLGRIGQDPELKYTQAGIAYTRISLGTNSGYKDKNTGQFVDVIDWHKITLFGNRAEIVCQYTQKGSMLYLEGRISYTKWQDQSDKLIHYGIEIVAHEVQFISGSLGKSDKKTQGYINVRQKPSNTSPSPVPIDQSKMPDINQILNDFQDDDIPF